MSVSAPWPVASAPFSDRRTVTSPCASLPPVMARTENKSSAASLATILSMARNAAVDLAVAVGFGFLLAAAVGERDCHSRALAVLRPRFEARQAPRVGVGGLAGERDEIFVVDLAFFVGEIFEAGESRVRRGRGIKHDSQIGEPRFEGVAPRQLAQLDSIRRPADILGAHNLVGLFAL